MKRILEIGIFHICKVNDSGWPVLTDGKHPERNIYEIISNWPSMRINYLKKHRYGTMKIWGGEVM